MRECRSRGYICDKTERWNAFAGPFGRHEDLFGFIDLIALDPKQGIIAIQSTGPHGHAKHRKDILVNAYALEWLKCGGVIEIWSWRKLKKHRGGKGRFWSPRIEPITKDMFPKAKKLDFTKKMF